MSFLSVLITLFVPSSIFLSWMIITYMYIFCFHNGHTSISIVDAGEEQTGDDDGFKLKLSYQNRLPEQVQTERRPQNGEQFSCVLSDRDVCRRVTSPPLIIMPRATNYVTCSIFTPTARTMPHRSTDDENGCRLS